jgi:two-component system NtrC family response regulator
VTKINVLFIDDEKKLVENAAPVLEAKGFEVLATTDIAKAIDAFANKNFDIVLVDIAMPPTSDMDAKALSYGRETGIEVIRRLRAIKSNVPIVVLTVIRDTAILSRIREAGVSQILNKPEEPERIADVLKRMVKK